MLINKIIKNNLLFRTIKSTLWKFSYYFDIKNNDYSVNFLHEGQKIVKLPKLSFLRFFFVNQKLARNNCNFFSRAKCEVLLRKTIFELYEIGYINKTLSIIDIGCWISDNSIVWSKFLSGDGIVYAIDPSADNISYGKTLAHLNNVENIRYLQAVCAEKVGIKLEFNGHIDHAHFKVSTSEKYINSSTIDQILKEDSKQIGLFHIDVEGFEFSVMKGAENMIKRDMPVIVFEQHISNEKVSIVLDYLKALNYRNFMINEVHPNANHDCRNFISLPAEKGMPNLKDIDQSEGRKIGFFSAVYGKSLIEV